MISVASPVTNFAKSSIAVLYTFGTQDGRLGFTILGLSTFLYVAFVSYSTITVRFTSRMLPSSRKVVSGVIRTKLPLRLYVYVCIYYAESVNMIQHHLLLPLHASGRYPQLASMRVFFNISNVHNDHM